MRREDAKSQNIKSGFDTIEKWRAENKEEELKYLIDVASNIRASIARSRKPRWLLVAVTKVDLLQSEIEEVENYYSPHGESEFSRTLNELVKFVGADNFEWDAVPVCSILEDFAWGSEVLESQLSEDERDHYLTQMISKLGEFCR